MAGTLDSALEPCACGRLRRATRALTQLYDDAMAPSGLRVTQFSVLRTLSREGPKAMTVLASTLLLDRTALTRTLDPLLERGLVEIVAGPDTRTRTVSLTAAGKRALRMATPYWQEAQQVVSQRVGAAKLEGFIAILRELEALHPVNGVRCNSRGSARGRALRSAA